MKTFRHALRNKEFALTAELTLKPSALREDILDQAHTVSGLVDAVQVTDNPGAHLHVSPMAAAAILINDGIDPVLQMDCRDRNRIALRSELFGAAALGVSSVLVMRGRDYPEDARPRIKPVYDWGARKLIACANSIEGTDFLVGSIATAFKPDRDWRPEKLGEKADAGVRFVQTQPCFDIDVLRHYMARLVAAKLVQRVNVIIGVAPIPSVEVAQWFGKNLRGAVVPAKVVQRLRQADDPRAEGIRICSELLQQVAEIPGVSGANVICLGDADAAAEAIGASGVYED
ncbi:MAG: methylenetetrahydrofolate reductase [Woeseiaceae bacterium]|nr:methylenetetrahydrofolate reductase [Woeseiaceae bacterium]